MSNSSFYSEFETYFRGSHEQIKERLKAYIPFLEPFLGKDSSVIALDLGCGRGEWLDLLRDLGITASGVDLDEGMLDQARARGLEVVHQDAIEALAQLPSNSLAIVSGFHIAEHLEFEHLGQLIAQAQRVLCPGGLLILETPNPENIAVATNYFYIDPTHVRPLPPDLMAFLPKYYDFFRSKIVRLQEDRALHGQPITQIAQIIHGVSPDYAVIAQKIGPANLTSSWDRVFEADFGITLGTLSTRYYEAQQADKHHFEGQLRALEQAQQADKHHFEGQLQALAAQADLWNRRYMEVIESRSWRITAPMRRLKLAYLHARQAGSNFYRLRLLGAIKAVLGKPVIRRNVGRLVRRFPALHRSLLAMTSKLGMLPPASWPALPSLNSQDFVTPEQIEAAQLSEYEQSILARMILAKRQKDD